MKPKQKKEIVPDVLLFPDLDAEPELPMFTHIDSGRMLKGDVYAEPVDAPEFEEWG